jgi:hypothetical protein
MVGQISPTASAVLARTAPSAARRHVSAAAGVERVAMLALEQQRFGDVNP